jgi:hypothetical protein
MPRGGRYLLFILTALILLLGVPLYQLSTHDNIGIHYKNYISEHISKYIAHGGVYNNTLHRQGTKGAVQAQWNTSTNPCHDFPNMDDITLIMKTGATEAYDKLPTQLLTNLQCVPDFLLFSDMVSDCPGDFDMAKVRGDVARQRIPVASHRTLRGHTTVIASSVAQVLVLTGALMDLA